MSDPPPPDHSQDSTVPIFNGNPTTISAKQYLVEIAWQAANQMEWNDIIMEITENRHGEQSGGRCPVDLKDPPGKQGGTVKKCQIDHAAFKKKRDALHAAKIAELKRSDPSLADKDASAKALTLLKNDGNSGWYNDFYSWCGDYTSWVFWKAWVLKGQPAAEKDTLKKIFNRVAWNDSGKWAPGDNINRVEKFAQGGGEGLVLYHPPKDKYVPKPGDMWMSNRGLGGHIGMVAACDPSKDELITLDGKSFDSSKEGWNTAAKKADEAAGNKDLQKELVQGEKRQGVARTRRSLKDLDLRAFLETTGLRKRLGYL
jgi:hypothetical protein